MVVAFAELDLLIVGIDARADGGGLGEIERRAGDGLQFAGGDQVGVHGGEAVGIDHDFVAQDVAFALAGEVEVGVVGQVDDGRLVGGGGVVDLELVLRGERVDHLRVRVPGKPSSPSLLT